MRFDQILLGQTDAPAHVSIIRHVGIADMSFMRSDPIGTVLPASDLIIASTLAHAHDNFLLTCSTVTRNVLTWSSASDATAVVLLNPEFAPLHRPSLPISSCLRLYLTCFSLKKLTLSPIVIFHFLGRIVLCNLAVTFAFRVLRSALAQDC